MDMLLVDGDVSLARLVLDALAPAGHRVLQVHGEAAWPAAPAPHTVLLDFDRPCEERMRVLHGLWSADEAGPAWLVTRPGSDGDCMLAQLLLRRQPAWAPHPSPVNHRDLRELSIERLLSLGCLVRGMAPRGEAGWSH